MTEQWTVEHVEVIDPTITSPLGGRAVLLGSGLLVQCSAGDMTATLTVTVFDGMLRCVGVDVRSTVHHPMTSEVLRTVPVARLMRQALAEIGEDVWAAQRATDASERMQAVTRHWLSLQGGPDGHRATQATADALCISRGYCSRLLTLARRSGLLPTSRS